MHYFDGKWTRHIGVGSEILAVIQKYHPIQCQRPKYIRTHRSSHNFETKRLVNTTLRLQSNAGISAPFLPKLFTFLVATSLYWCYQNDTSCTAVLLNIERLVEYVLLHSEIWYMVYLYKFTVGCVDRLQEGHQSAANTRPFLSTLCPRYEPCQTFKE